MPEIPICQDWKTRIRHLIIWQECYKSGRIEDVKKRFNVNAFCAASGAGEDLA